MLTDKYDRLKLIPNWNQERLAEAKVAVVGCGALGNEVLKNLALLGIGQIWVVDYDTIERHNLTRSVLFRESDIGRHKAEVASERVKELNPDVLIHPVIGKLELAFGRGLLREMDVVIGCLDNVEARRILNKRCYFVNVPWIDGGINESVGNVTLYDPRVPSEPCYRCQMSNSEWKALKKKYSCGYLRDDYQDPKMATTAMTASVVAAYQVQVAIQELLNKKGFKPGTLLFLPVSPPIGFHTTPLTLNKGCPDHELILQNQNIPTYQFRLDCTPVDVAAFLELGDDWKMELPFDFVSKFICCNDSCKYVESIRTPRREIKQSQVICPKCGATDRKAINYFEVTKDCEDSQEPFRVFRLCEREIIQYIKINTCKRINVELVSSN